MKNAYLNNVFIFRLYPLQYKKKKKTKQKTKQKYKGVAANFFLNSQI
jgi:hypothetical protein